MELSSISDFMANGWSGTPDYEIFQCLQIVEEEMLSGNFDLAAFSSIINSLLKTNSSTIKSTLWNYHRELLITSFLKFLNTELSSISDFMANGWSRTPRYSAVSPDSGRRNAFGEF